jgi:pimeloyl-ACP methyl ester carboxylesterase
MRRVILSWRILDDDLIGTYHEPAEIGIGERNSQFRIGVLLLNSGPAPRSGNSDLSVHIGDRLASRGIPVFRFDLPGLGDSSGSTPPDSYAYWQEVLRGRNDAATLELVGKLKQKFGLSSLIIGGLCAAAVPTLRVADSDAGAIAGVILMEPILCYFENNIPVSSQARSTAVFTMKLKSKLRKAFSIQEWFMFLTGHSRVASALRSLRPFLIRVQKQLVGHTLPKDMNVPLFIHWRDSLARGTHSLVIIANGQGNDRYVGHAIDSLPENLPGEITLIQVPQTNHIFTGGYVRDAVIDAVVQWIEGHFSC